MRKTLGPFIVVLLLMAASAGGQNKPAGTADWQTPAQETICDDLTGAAGGLCNAYCEALDCHLDNPQGSDQACQRLLSQFLQIAGVNPPCEQQCPCVELTLYGQIMDGTVPAQECFIIDVFGKATEVDVIAATGTAAAITGEPTPRCGEFPDFGSATIFEITLAQAQACNQQLQAAAAQQGVLCQNVILDNDPTSSEPMGTGCGVGQRCCEPIPGGCQLCISETQQCP